MSEESGNEGRDDASRTRARWFGVLLILVALGAATYEALTLEERTEAPPEAARTADWDRPSLSQMLGAASAAAPEAGAPLAAQEAASSVPLADGEYEVCGIGRVKVDPDKVPEWLARQQPAIDRLEARVLDGMSASTNEGERAAGLFARSLLMRTKFAESAAPGVAETPDGGGPSMAEVEGLATMAVSTSSPEVYSLALHACDRAKRPGTCQMLSAEQWSRLDPDNAAPWLRLATEASARRQPGGVAEALYRASLARTNDTRTAGLLKYALPRMGGDATPFARYNLAVELTALAMSHQPSYEAVSAWCDRNTVADGNRRQSCGALGEMLVSKGRTMLDVSYGTSIGERSGLPAERVKALKDETAAAMEIVVGMSRGDGSMFSCDTIGREMYHFTRLANDGEKASLQALVKQSPDGVAGLAKRYARRNAEAASAARAGESGERAAGVAVAATPRP